MRSRNSFWRKRAEAPRRTLAVAFILIAILGALYYVFSGPGAQQRRAGRFAAEGPVPVLATSRHTCRCPGLSRRRWYDQSAQHRNRASAGRRQVAERQLQGRRRRQEGRRAGAHRSCHLIRRNSTRRSPRKRRTRRSWPIPRLISSRYERLAATSAINKQQADTQRSVGGAKCRAGTGRPGGDRQCTRDARLHDDRCAARRPHRYPTWSTKEISSVPPMPHPRSW